MSEKEGSEKAQVDVSETTYWLCVILGGLLVLGMLAVVILHMYDPKDYPKPVDVEASIFMGIGLALIVLFNVPWTKIRVGEIEIERALEEQATDYAEETEKLQGIITKLEAALQEKQEDEKSEAPKNLDIAFQSQVEKEIDFKQEADIILNYLGTFPTYGFTASKIKSSCQGLPENLSTSRIRTVLASLIKDSQVRTRVSKQGNILYQKA